MRTVGEGLGDQRGEGSTEDGAQGVRDQHAERDADLGEGPEPAMLGGRRMFDGPQRSAAPPHSPPAEKPQLAPKLPSVYKVLFVVDRKDPVLPDHEAIPSCCSTILAQTPMALRRTSPAPETVVRGVETMESVTRLRSGDVALHQLVLTALLSINLVRLTDNPPQGREGRAGGGELGEPPEAGTRG